MIRNINKLFDIYEKLNEKGEDTSSIIEEIASHKDIVSYVIEEDRSDLLHEILFDGLDLSKEISNKVELLLIIDYLMIMHLGSSIKEVSDKDKRRLCTILYNIYNSNYKLTDEESKKLDSAIGLVENTNKETEPIKDIEDGVNPEKKISDLDVGDKVSRHFSNKTVIEGEIVAINPKKSLLCKYNCGGVVFYSLFALNDGLLIDSKGNKIDIGYITPEVISN